MKKLLFLLAFAFTINVSNASLKTVNVNLKETKKTIVNKNTISKTNKSILKKYATLCSVDIPMISDCPDGSYEISGNIILVYWCESGVINWNVTTVTTVIPDCYLMYA